MLIIDEIRYGPLTGIQPRRRRLFAIRRLSTLGLPPARWGKLLVSSRFLFPCWTLR
jgi:hypothetical protein